MGLSNAEAYTKCILAYVMFARCFRQDVKPQADFNLVFEASLKKAFSLRRKRWMAEGHRVYYILSKYIEDE